MKVGVDIDCFSGGRLVRRCVELEIMDMMDVEPRDVLDDEDPDALCGDTGRPEPSPVTLIVRGDVMSDTDSTVDGTALVSVETELFRVLTLLLGTDD
jgi:hypothetical protein